MGADGFSFPHEYRRAYPNRHCAGAQSDSRAHANHDAYSDGDGHTKPSTTHTDACAHLGAGVDCNRGTDTNRRAHGHCSAHT